ncbi:MAG: SurA N-terminal domain-containing protein [Candidatus Omnitrophica bacterium]|nr:SurA N-terminal domain-containing protein [Candidatus Omnitrophota bacterium]MDD5592600.1 SurA N-terminal domain-containing protein [Candidatus Omnitrophota bacterium]
MKKYLVILCVSFLFFGCTAKPKDKIILAKINDYEITREEFYAALKDSMYGMADTPESRQEFLDNLINQKLILQEAQKKGLDKETNFLKTIERFWEQSLLKIALDKKTKEISSNMRIGDKDIQEAYQKMSQAGEADKTYDQMYNQLKWELTKAKESEEINKWITELHNKAQVKVDYDLLK